MHYGLNRTKDEARAKWRLLEAINSKALRVAVEVSVVERKLHEKRNTANEKSRPATTPSGAKGAAGQIAPGKKRKKSEEHEDSGSPGLKAKETHSSKAGSFRAGGRDTSTPATKPLERRRRHLHSTRRPAEIYKTMQTA